MKKIVLILTFALASSSAALACTPQELQAKLTQLTTRIQTLAATNPQKVTDVSQKLGPLQARQTTDLDGVCKKYDEFLAELN